MLNPAKHSKEKIRKWNQSLEEQTIIQQLIVLCSLSNAKNVKNNSQRKIT